MIISNIVVYQNPISHHAIIEYCLSETRLLRLRIRHASSQTIVRDIVLIPGNVSCREGLNKVFWDGNSRSGEPIDSDCFEFEFWDRDECISGPHPLLFEFDRCLEPTMDESMIGVA